jgi:hypothetical protein
MVFQASRLVRDVVTDSGTAGTGREGRTAGAACVTAIAVAAAPVATTGFETGSEAVVTLCGMAGSAGASTGLRNRAASEARRDTRPGSAYLPTCVHFANSLAAPPLSHLFSSFNM